MSRLADFLSVVQSVVVIAFAIFAASVYYFPEFERRVEIAINREAWYYVGKYVPRPGDAEHGPGGWEGDPEGCAGRPNHPERSFYHTTWDEDRPFDDADLERLLPGQILVSVEDAPVTLGRLAAADDMIPAADFSDNPVIAVAQPRQCYYVVRMAKKLRDLKTCDGVDRQSHLWWALAVRISCD